MTERWLPVVGYEGMYEVSDRGTVRSLDRLEWSTTPQGHRFQRRRRGKIRKLEPLGDHLAVGLSKDAKGHLKTVHRLVLEAFVGPCPEDMECCRHLNGVGTDNRLENLVWGTTSQNIYDAVAHGTHLKTRIKSCPRDHKLEEPNLLPWKRGHRECYACRLAYRILQTVQGGGRNFKEVADERYAALLAGWRPPTGNPTGSKHPLSKLTEEIVCEARFRYSAGETGTSLAAEYGVATTTLCAAIKGRTWSHVK